LGAWGASGSAGTADRRLSERFRGAPPGDGAADSPPPAADPIAERSFLLNASLSQADDNALNVERLIQRQASAFSEPPRAESPAPERLPVERASVEISSPPVGERAAVAVEGSGPGVLGWLLAVGMAATGAAAAAGWWFLRWRRPRHT
jgi:hypothetical protein